MTKKIRTGEEKAHRAYENQFAGIPVLKEKLFTDEVEDFVKTLRAAGRDEVIIDCEEGLMREMVDLAEAGCEMKGLFKTVTRTKTVEGVLFKLNRRVGK